MNDGALPLPRGQATQIARAYLPTSALGNRWDYYYTRSKLSRDPLYPGVLQALRDCPAPILDLGCGLGLLAHALRGDGQPLAYFGVDNDAGKIQRARQAAARAQLSEVGFEVVDLAHGLPLHTGSVAILDVLQYLDMPAQQRLLEQAIALLVPGARLVIRTGFIDGSPRGRTSKWADRAANLIGWMQSAPRAYPDAAQLRRLLEGAGLHITLTSLSGSTPFNNWLLVAQRPSV